MDIISTPLDGFIALKLKKNMDDRGSFKETYQKKRYHNIGIFDEFMQENHSHSKNRILRGMHYQINRPQAKIITVIRGSIYDVAVDLRLGSKTFGQWHGVIIDADGPIDQIYISEGFAHGFCVLSDCADIHYMVSNYYDFSDEGGLNCYDPNLNIQWPIESPIISIRDSSFPNLVNINKNYLPKY